MEVEERWRGRNLRVEAERYVPTKNAILYTLTHELYAVASRTLMINPGMVGKTPMVQARRARQWKPWKYLYHQNQSPQ